MLPAKAATAPPLRTVTATGTATPADAAPASSATLTCLRIGLAADEPPRWCAVLSTLSTLRSLDLHATSLANFPTSMFAVAMHGLHALERLHLRMSAPVPLTSHNISPLFAGMTCVPGLASLRFDSCFDAGFCTAAHPTAAFRSAAAFAHLGHLPALTHLSLQGNRVSQSVATGALARVIGGIHTLRVLCLADCGPAATLVETACAGRALPALEDLELGGCAVSPSRLEAALRVVRVRRCGDGLTRLNLAGAGLQRADGRALAALLEAQPRLQAVELPGNRLEDEGLQAVAGALAGLREVQCVNVHGNGATVAGLAAVSAALAWDEMRGGRRLTALNVGGNAVCERREEFVRGLQGLPGLQVLDVSGMDLGPRGVGMLLRGLVGATCLGRLDCSRNGLESMDVIRLVQEFAALPALRRVDVEQGMLFAYGAVAEAFAAAAPWLQVDMIPGLPLEDKVL